MKTKVLIVLISVCGNILAESHVFCTDAYNACLIDPSYRDSLRRGGQLPAGMLFYPDSGTLLWNPDDTAIGTHHILLSSTQTGSKETGELNIEVKEAAKVLCVFAHSDDEFGIIGKIVQLKEAGKEVFLVWTRVSGDKRNNESRKAMRRIGISEEEMSFLYCGNISSPDIFPLYVEHLAALISKHRFDQIYVVGYEGGHIEHDLTHIATVSACRRIGFAGQIYEFGLYHLAHLTPQPFSLVPAPSPAVQMSLDKRSLDFVEALSGLYESQKYLVLGFKLGMSVAKKSHPCYRPLPNWDYSRPPSSGLLWYEANLKHPASFKKHIRPALEALWQTHPVVVSRNGYAQDVRRSQVGALVLPDIKKGEVIDVGCPYSIYAYAGMSLLLLGAGCAVWLPYRSGKNERRK